MPIGSEHECVNGKNRYRFAFKFSLQHVCCFWVTSCQIKIILSGFTVQLDALKMASSKAETKGGMGGNGEILFGNLSESLQKALGIGQSPAKLLSLCYTNGHNAAAN